MNYSSYFYAVANARNFVLHHCFKYMHAPYYRYILSLIRFLNKANIFTSTYIGLRIYLMPLSISYHFGLYHSLLRIVHILRSRVILVVLMRLAYVSQNNKQIYFSFPLDVSFLTFFSISLFVSLFSPFSPIDVKALSRLVGLHHWQESVSLMMMELDAER